MARIDGAHSVADLAGLTGLAPERLEQIVTKLAFTRVNPPGVADPRADRLEDVRSLRGGAAQI